MQEQKASKAAALLARLGIWNIIWLGVCAFIMLAVAVVWFWPHRKLPTATWREANITFPWATHNLVIKALNGHWASSEGHERMALRAAYYPVAELEFGDFSGSGMLYITFTDGAGHQAGDTIPLYYKDGVFTPRRDVNIRTEGKKVQVFIEAGYESRSEFDLHQLDEESPLWRVLVHYRPEGVNHVQAVGFVTIPAIVR